MARQITITVETDSLLVLRGCKPLRAWCPQCGVETEVIPLDDIGVISNLRPREVQAWIEDGKFHRTLSADGVSLICLNSMLRRVRKPGAASQGEAVAKRRKNEVQS